TVIIAKKEVRRYPVLGWLYAVTGNALIDRSNTRSAIRTLRRLERRMLRQGISVWIFPEGTWGREPGRLLPFKQGAFRMAISTGVPLVPVVVSPLSPK